ncbi:16792_t:CDS:1, partial [Cetraspora pellucida]
NRERLSITLCSNANESHKLNPLVIGKYVKSCCFKNIKISNMLIMYRNNAKAWMLIVFFQEWLQEFDFQVVQKHHGQHVLLILDQCTSHKIDNLNLQYVEVYFLPSKTTLKIQPIDARIIM